MNNDKILNADEIYKLIDKQIGINKIKTFLKDGQIPSKKVGKTYVAEKNDVVDFFRNYYISNNQEQQYAN